MASPHSAISAPIKPCSRKGFVIGWIAIVCVGAAGFVLATLPLGHSSLEPRVAQATPVPSATPRG